MVPEPVLTFSNQMTLKSDDEDEEEIIMLEDKEGNMKDSPGIKKRKCS